MSSSSRSPHARWTYTALRVATVIIMCLLGGAFILVDASAAAAHIVIDSSHSESTARWAWPLWGAHTLDRGFEAPESRYGAGHRGIDIPSSLDAEVRAPADGIVHFAGVVVDRPVLTLDNGDGVLSSFEAIDAHVTEGDVVSRGDVIGTIAFGPHCDADCLHVGVRVHGEYVNPMLFFGEVPFAVLLPLG